MQKAAEQNEKPSIGFTSWYVNPHRVLELIGPDEEYQSVIATSGEGLGKLRLMSEISSRLLAWLRKTSVPSLEALLLEGKLGKGKIFTFDGRFFSSGLAGDRLPKNGLMRLRLPLREFGDPRQLFLKFHRDGLTTSTARGKLMGQPSVFTLGYVDSIAKSAVIARPFIIADLVEHFGDARFRYRDHLQVQLADFDAFQRVDFTRKYPNSS